MPLTDVLRELQLLIRSRYGLVVLVASGEDRTHSLLRLLAAGENMPLLVWQPALGLRAVTDAVAARPVGRGGSADGPGGGHGSPAPNGPGPNSQGIYNTQTIDSALDHLRSATVDALYVFEGAGPLLSEPGVRARLLEVARRFGRSRSALVLVGSDIEVPADVLPHGAVFHLPEPRDAEYRELLGRLVHDLTQAGPYVFDLTPSDTERLLAGLRGLSLLEAEKILTKAVIEDGRLGPADVTRVLEAKRQVVEREGLLEYFPVKHALPEVAGMEALKAWLRRRRRLFERPEEARAFGLDFPRGILLLGVPGVGKSLAAKAVAAEWGLPLLRMDPSSLYNRYVGETERNFRRATRTAERVAPVVLWIDEIEKAFAAGGDEDGGLSTRTLGAFLSWLQERRGDVFVAATANGVRAVPPELLRKGRFDELFFLDLPGEAVRHEILRLHLQRRGHDAARVDMDVLAAASGGFSGAELEAAVVSALYAAFDAGSAVSTDLLLAEVQATRPLSVTRAEEVAALRAWARERAVSAD